MPDLPAGTVTFLLTDIEGSTRLWEQYPEAMRAALARHDALASELIARHAGALVKSRGEGDSLFAVFGRAADAVTAAYALQQAFAAETWVGALREAPLRVRIALHTGEADCREGDYYGPAVNRCARLRAAGHGGQILLSLTTGELVQDQLPDGVSLRDLGERRLKDLIRPERVFQLVHPALPQEFPPLATLDVRPHNLPAQTTPLIGREQEVAQARALLVGQANGKAEGEGRRAESDPDSPSGFRLPRPGGTVRGRARRRDRHRGPAGTRRAHEPARRHPAAPAHQPARAGTGGAAAAAVGSRQLPPRRLGTVRRGAEAAGAGAGANGGTGVGSRKRRRRK